MRSPYAYVLLLLLFSSACRIAAQATGPTSESSPSADPSQLGGSISLSAYLREPERMRSHLIASADFWMQLRDQEHGGYFTSVAQDGSVIDPQKKSLVVQSRNAYGFSRAFMVTGDAQYLDHAEHALAFLYRYGWDQQHDGWFFTADREGTILPYGEWWDPNSFKWTFAQHYALLGIVATYEAGRSDRELDWLRRGLDSNERHLWDTASGGYFERAEADWSEPKNKGFTGTIDGITTHALSAYLTLGSPELGRRLFELADIAAEKLAGSMEHPAVRLGFAERYDRNWRIDIENSKGSVGHQLKVVWCLSRAYLLDPKPQYAAAAERLLEDVFEHDMYDVENGGPYMDYDYRSGEVKRDEKDYWMTEQAIMAGLTLAQVTDDRALGEKALAMASDTLDFYMANFVDPVYGSTFSQLTPEGIPTNTTKGDTFKGGYHNIETAYLSYLYASAFITRQAFTLYYRFPSADQDRIVTMTPIPAPDLAISHIQLDGKPYSNFDGITRALRIPAGTGGVFAVTYDPG
jgi:mannobiose 2-epimerase